MTMQRTLRWRTHQVLESGLGHRFSGVAINVALLVVIVANEFAVIAGTIPSVVTTYGNLLSFVAFVTAWYLQLNLPCGSGPLWSCHF